MSLRRITSLTLVWTFLLLLVTGIILYIEPQGRVAYWADWHLLGLSKEQWDDIHTMSGLLMILSGILHIYYNWRPIMNYLKDKARRLTIITPEFRVATLIAAALVGLTLADAPPASWILDLSGSIKDGFAARLGEPPYGHAEKNALAAFCRQMGYDLDRALDRLRAAGIVVEGPDRTLLEIAAANHTSPQHLHSIIAPAGEKAPQAAGGLPEQAPMGLGRRTVAGICETYGLEQERVLAVLREMGLEASGGSTLRELAQEHDLSAQDLYHRLRENLAGR